MVFVGGWRSGGPRRRYRGPYGYPGGGGYGYGYGPRRGGGGCLRDACLLETGCCLSEALGGNCLVSGVAVLPRFASALLPGPVPSRRQSGSRITLRDRLIAMIRVYQETISPHLADTCRFAPSCSHYAVQA